MHIVKKFKQFINEKLSTDNYYTTSTPMTIDEFIEIEVDDRENYDIDEVNEWIDKYNIQKDDKLIWISTKPYIAARYQMPAKNWNNAEKIYNKNPNKFDVKVINSNDGFLIPETDDGDDGFIFVLK